MDDRSTQPVPALKDRSLLTDKAYVAGRWLGAVDGRTITVTDPFDGSVIARVPDLGVEVVRQAIDAAALAQAEWARRSAKERAAVLRRWYELIVENADDLAQILTAEQGKPLGEAKGEILSNAAYLEWFGEEAKRIDGDIIPGPNRNQRIMVLKQPVGVCAAITPWNFPNGMITRKAGPALAAGCSMILKPAAQTPLSAFALAVLAERAGVPAGVFSVITGEARPIGMEFCHNPKVAKITFTGSTGVGRWLMKEAADGIKRLSLELGGNAPFIVFDDADIDAAVEGAMISKFRNAGQTCVCANRIYVQETVAEAFTARLLEKVSAITLGRGTQAGVSQGPLIDDRAVTKMEEHVSDALAKGGRILVGGKRSALGGTFFEPTVMSGITQDMKVAKEETFAPLAPIITFRDEDEVIAMANDSEFGLASYFYARDLGRVWRVAEALEAGMVGVNTGMLANEMAPFGGVKQSGMGREGSSYGIEGFLELKYVAVAGI
ncbi:MULTISPECIES: NAD-dependent succinate-semialdehyde dehydrogenase [unclassified Shinella]|uniref:NAD-dependent succinate-semialdehyde dehydrogenase n=1 Tax=unclassified Shinella TaxID=2643062 RepID=UPI00225CE59E|nr:MULTISPECIES: NAD-dependent succinate-semialdehyde dehydrogenase [unclassified Shinella]MCO5137630.1 NAD-dependent succinate-semialdehyde dehydrogenase [Shinella sp.]MDC7257748.1 NAD-dependent succinate-semialdehyde dehydrogenase [Shinella sp. YE25]CAI0335508.1 succinate-semialdehyde dehydrogenase (NADP(+)) GabD [Rhizobiaceae bacterium]CAK7259814.1 succinate-semialdehyde dehydrogenase (NADP(+)) GabD [Shinella sp. WSC3-e]